MLLSQFFHNYRFYLRTSRSPTYHNLAHNLQQLGWSPAKFSFFAHFNERNFEFYAPAAECLEFKHLLAQLVTAFNPPIMPLTYCINDTNWEETLKTIAKDFYTKNSIVVDEQQDLAWILKPSLLNNGQHIQIFNKLSQIEHHYLSAQRMGGEHVLQRYLHPHLLQGPHAGHKFSIRMLVIVTNYAGAFIYPQGYFNIALKPYQDRDFTDLRPHLTNEHLSEEELNVVQIPTNRYPFFDNIYPDIKHISSTVVNASSKAHPQICQDKQEPKLAIFGFDFIVDQQTQVWLLEANHAPCFPIDPQHPLQASLYQPFWQAFIEHFVVPIAAKQIVKKGQYSPFEPLK